jgi:hypothetical protein
MPSLYRINILKDTLKQFKDNWVMYSDRKYQYITVAVDLSISVIGMLLKVGFWRIVMINGVVTTLLSLYYSIKETRDSIKHIVRFNAVKSINRLFEKDKQ